MSERQSKREQFNTEKSTGKKLLIPAAVLVLVAVVAAAVKRPVQRLLKQRAANKD